MKSSEVKCQNTRQEQYLPKMYKSYVIPVIKILMMHCSSSHLEILAFTQYSIRIV